MDITNKIGQRALTYVAAVASQGYELTFAEFEAYVSMPMPGAKALLPGATRPGPGGPRDGAVEPILDWLTRLGWLERGESTVRITQLGRAVLRAVERKQREVELPSEVTLGQGEPFDYGRVLGHVAEQRDALLVDPFLTAEQLMDIVHRTAVTRVLVGAGRRHEAQRRGLAEALSRTIGLDRPFYIGVSGELRDRYLIPPSGPVSFLATSVGRGGERLALIGTIQQPIADSVRRIYEDVWSRATPLVAEPLVNLDGDLGVGGTVAPLGGDAMGGVRGDAIGDAIGDALGGDALGGDAPPLASAQLNGDLGMIGLSRNGDLPHTGEGQQRPAHQEERQPRLRSESWQQPKQGRGADQGRRDDGKPPQPWTMDEPPHGG